MSIVWFMSDTRSVAFDAVQHVQLQHTGKGAETKASLHPKLALGAADGTASKVTCAVIIGAGRPGSNFEAIRIGPVTAATKAATKMTHLKPNIKFGVPFSASA
jgi:hypothetical protein